MNFSQYAGILRIIVPAGLSYAMGKGWITQDAITQIGSIVATLLAASGWSASANTDSNIVKAASNVDGLAQPIKIAPDAPLPLLQLAHDDSVPNVKPELSPTPTMRR